MAFTIATKTRATKNSTATREEDEFAGLWINVGVETQIEDSDETHFNRIPRGIAVSDLKDHKIYASTNPEWAEEAALVNSIMDMIREEGMKLEEGESIPINLSVQLYRRQEQVDQVVSKADNKDLKAKLFAR